MCFSSGKTFLAAKETGNRIEQDDIPESAGVDIRLFLLKLNPLASGSDTSPFAFLVNPCMRISGGTLLLLRFARSFSMEPSNG